MRFFFCLFLSSERSHFNFCRNIPSIHLMAEGRIISIISFFLQVFNSTCVTSKMTTTFTYGKRQMNRNLGVPTGDHEISSKAWVKLNDNFRKNTENNKNHFENSLALRRLLEIMVVIVTFMGIYLMANIRVQCENNKINLWINIIIFIHTNVYWANE